MPVDHQEFIVGYMSLDFGGETKADQQKIAKDILEKFGAPDRDAARAAAREEIDFAASLCGHPVNTVLALHRTLEGGEIRETFRTLRPRAPTPGGDPLHAHARAFEFVETDEEEPAEQVDLVGLMGVKR